MRFVRDEMTRHVGEQALKRHPAPPPQRCGQLAREVDPSVARRRFRACVWMTIVLYEPATGCDPLGVTAARQRNDICEPPPHARSSWRRASRRRNRGTS